MRTLFLEHKRSEEAFAPHMSVVAMMKIPNPIDGLATDCVASEDASSDETLLDVLEKAGIAKRF